MAPIRILNPLKQGVHEIEIREENRDWVGIGIGWDQHSRPTTYVASRISDPKNWWYDGFFRENATSLDAFVYI